MSFEVETEKTKERDFSCLGCILGIVPALFAVVLVPIGAVIWILAVGLVLPLLPGSVRKDRRCCSGYDDLSMGDCWVV
ncbi:hypothetical protein OROMI_023655 [Orobanche minor]